MVAEDMEQPQTNVLLKDGHFSILASSIGWFQEGLPVADGQCDPSSYNGNPTLGCKRILLSDDFYPTVIQPNVEVISERIREARAHSIVAGDGKEYEVEEAFNRKVQRKMQGSVWVVGGCASWYLDATGRNTTS